MEKEIIEYEYADLLGMTEQEQWVKAFSGMEDYHRERAIENMFIRKSLDCDMPDYNVVIRCWVWLKTFLCLVLNRTSGSYINSGSVNVLSYDWEQGYESQSWRSVWVDSPKLFSGWQVCLASDGT